ncbi:LysR family transcriptional regulator [Pseudoxanthomonas sp.]|uniref:LysR family transcriptional regulator n=1 Tax=Pseudoxanthomonas sp. TaxID=1871049 RepID=UPI002622EC34|nr:LysR family transcriptional regulator [Pseudoxanthomonas sp.]WDS35809.1 MAG: LysR family transcriptional regulator [Pseudoxanthomonas sp.]
MIRIDDVRVFLQTVDAGSFSAAARRLDITPALASSSVMRLEQGLGVRLFVRSTRQMRLSAEGERYLPHARAMLEAEQAGLLALQDGRGQLAGTLRLAMPSDLGRNLLLPWLDAFQQRHPGIRLDLSIGDRNVDFFAEQLDAGIRYGRLGDSSLVALPLAPHNRRALCAAPAYLERHGWPRHPRDLAGHNCLRYVMGEATYERWRFHLPEGVETVQIDGDRISDDADIVRRWAVAGMGMVYKSRLDLHHDLQAGRLVDVFAPDWGVPAPLQLVIAHRAMATPLVRALHAELRTQLEALDRGPVAASR